MKSTNFKEFFTYFKKQTKCIVCGLPLYISKISDMGEHISKLCGKGHAYHAYAYSLNIKSLNALCIFNQEGLLTSLFITKNKESSSSNTPSNIKIISSKKGYDNLLSSPVDICNIITIYDEKSFIDTIKNWIILL